MREFLFFTHSRVRNSAYSIGVKSFIITYIQETIVYASDISLLFSTLLFGKWCTQARSPHPRSLALYYTCNCHTLRNSPCNCLTPVIQAVVPSDSRHPRADHLVYSTRHRLPIAHSQPYPFPLTTLSHPIRKLVPMYHWRISRLALSLSHHDSTKTIWDSTSRRESSHGQIRQRVLIGRNEESDKD